MPEPLHKTEVANLDATPEKRMFWSIISDYDLATGLCELIDNAIDIWMAKKARGDLNVEITLDADRQLIAIKDNAGGVKYGDLRLLVTPGGSRNDPDSESIGIFGVGSKRAVVALAEQTTIKTRYADEASYQIDLTKDWLTSEEWEIPAYKIPAIESGVTVIELSHLRRTFSEVDVESLTIRFGEIYSWFLLIEGFKIIVNGKEVKAISFENWAFPPNHPPKSASFTTTLQGQEKVSVDITGGLIRDRNPEIDNYGVYFYCNHRLIVKELKSREVGYYVTSEAGVPHPDASLCRVIVSMNGMAKLMPWNSSKTGINFGLLAFQQLRPTLIQLVSHFSSLSRRLKDDWDSNVFRFKSGEIQSIPPAQIGQGKKLILPPLPHVKRSHSEQLVSSNKSQIVSQPWVLGLVEAIAAVDIVSRQRGLQTRNRIALILLDSNFEIGLKEFIVNREDLFPPSQFNDAKILSMFKDRPQVITAVAQKIKIPQDLLTKARSYYRLRNKLIHERATVGITDHEVEDYRSVVTEILKRLFDLNF